MTFLNEVFTQPELLEKITGLDKLREDVANEEFEWDESD